MIIFTKFVEIIILLVFILINTESLIVESRIETFFPNQLRLYEIISRSDTITLRALDDDS